MPYPLLFVPKNFTNFEAFVKTKAHNFNGNFQKQLHENIVKNHHVI